jgi:nitrate reductase (cytochrome), electron transfer subunit
MRKIPILITAILLAVAAYAAAYVAVFSGSALAQSSPSTTSSVTSSSTKLTGLRGETPLQLEVTPPPIPKIINDDIRRGRAFAMQPPVIPHQIENYQIDKNFNKCMTCHARDRVADSQAPMVSVTHYMDRNNNFRSEISPRRYFCNQCHVPQNEVKLLVDNKFVDAETARKSPKTVPKNAGRK